MQGPSFVGAYAPIFRLTSGDGPPDAGIDTSGLVSEEIDRQTGMPRPFIQSNGVREYQGVQGLRGRAMPSYTPGPAVTDELRGTTEPEYFTDEGGFPLNYYREDGGQPQFAPSQYPGALGRQPEAPPSIEQQRRTPGMAPTVGIPSQVEEYPPERHVPRRAQPGDANPPIAPYSLSNGGMGVRVPAANQQENLDNPAQDDLDFSSSAPKNLLQRWRQRQGEGPRGPVGSQVRGAIPHRSDLPRGGNDQRMDTLGSLIERFSTIFPRDSGNAGPSASASVPRDPNRNLGTMGDLASYPDFSSENGLADFNRRFGAAARELERVEYNPIGPQGRSAAQQQRYMEEWRRGERSQRPANGGYHVIPIDGVTRAADIQPHRIGGLRGPANVGRVRDILTRAGYPADMDVRWEENPPHYHVEPPPRFDSRLRQ